MSKPARNSYSGESSELLDFHIRNPQSFPSVDNFLIHEDSDRDLRVRGIAVLPSLYVC
jgi:hypothetical protein